MKSIRFYIAALLLTMCSMANAQYLNVFQNGTYTSFEVTEHLRFFWGKYMELTKEFNINIGTNPELVGKTVTVVLANGNTYEGTIGSDGKLDILVDEADKGQATSKIVYGNVDGEGNIVFPITQSYTAGSYDQSAMPLVGTVDPVTGNVTFEQAGAVVTIPSQTITEGSTVTLSYKVDGEKKTITLDGTPTGTENLGFVIEPGATDIILDRGDNTGFAPIKPVPDFEAGDTHTITGCNWVQLWENGPKFAEYNVGATSADQYGDYFTWGGTHKNGAGKEWKDDHNTGSGDLEGDNDTATKLWGSSWRMPKSAELETLAAGLTWTNNYKESSVNGAVFTGQGEYSNSLFLPAAGCCQDGNLKSLGRSCYYYSSTIAPPNVAPGWVQQMYGSATTDPYVMYVNRYSACSVRAVINEIPGATNASFKVDLNAPAVNGILTPGTEVKVVYNDSEYSPYTGVVGKDGKIHVVVSGEDESKTPSKILYGEFDSEGNPVFPTEQTQSYTDGSYDPTAMPLVGTIDGEGNVTFEQAGAVVTIPSVEVEGSTATLTYNVNGEMKTIDMTGLTSGSTDLSFVVQPGATNLVLDKGNHTGYAIDVTGSIEAGDGNTITKGHPWVQLWENGPKWAEYNVGVTNRMSHSKGGYYTWGGTYENGEGDYNDDHYTGSGNLSGNNDTATNLWGSNWRMPTEDELQGLLSYCSYQWKSVNYVNGIEFRDRNSFGNSVFLPVAGYHNGNYVSYETTRGHYWSSTSVYNLFFSDEDQYISAGTHQDYALSVRAVINEIPGATNASFNVDLNAPAVDGILTSGTEVKVVYNGSEYSPYTGVVGKDGKIHVVVSGDDESKTPTKILYGHDSNGNPIVPTTQNFVDGSCDPNALPLVGTVDGSGNVTFTPVAAVVTVPSVDVKGGTATLTYKVSGSKKTINMIGLTSGSTKDLKFVVQAGSTNFVLDKGNHTGYAINSGTIINGNNNVTKDHPWVQLWENGPKFAEYNVGVTDGKATSYGGYYTWGGTYKNGDGIPWQDDHNTGSGKLLGNNDTATNLWGSNWCMPTKTELETLAAGLTWTNDYKESGIKGAVFTGQGDYSNSLFLPAPGSCNNGEVWSSGWEGKYLSSMLWDSNYACHLIIDPFGHKLVGGTERQVGHSVRAVIAE